MARLSLTITGSGLSSVNQLFQLFGLFATRKPQHENVRRFATAWIARLYLISKKHFTTFHSNEEFDLKSIERELTVISNQIELDGFEVLQNRSNLVFLAQFVETFCTHE